MTVEMGRRVRVLRAVPAPHPVHPPRLAALQVPAAVPVVILRAVMVTPRAIGIAVKVTVVGAAMYRVA